MSKRSQAKLGTCRLCQQSRVLKNSHILPSWMFRRLLPGDEKQFIRIGEGAIVLTNNNFREYLFCEDCEKIFKVDEDHVVAISRHDDGTFSGRDGLRVIPILQPEDPHRDASAIGPASLGRFAIGVYWRASVSTHFSMTLPPDVSEGVRLFLLGQAGLPDNVTLVATVLVPEEPWDPATTRPDELSSSPSRLEEFDGVGVASFVVFGFSFRLYVFPTSGAHKASTIARLDLLRAPTPLVLLTDGSTEYRHWRNKRANSEAKGKRLLELIQAQTSEGGRM